jgi:hypothetical protein
MNEREPLTRGAMLKALVEEVRYRRGRLTRITAEDYELILVALASSPAPAGLDACEYCGSTDRWLHYRDCGRYYGGLSLDDVAVTRPAEDAGERP